VSEKNNFDELADSAFVRIAQLVRTPSHPREATPIPFSAPTLWRKVKTGDFPAPVKLSERVTAWRVSDVRAWLSYKAGGKREL
jgi:prophage regulatory protein